MTRQDLDIFRRAFAAGEGAPPESIAGQVLALVEDQAAFIRDLCEHYARPAGPEKVAEHYALSRRAHALAQRLEPVKQRNNAITQ